MARQAEALVGRDRELERLEGVLDGLDSGSGRIVVITGEPGIGKTRLLAELAGRADARGCLVLEGRGAEFERELPFGVVVAACDEYLASLDARTAERLAGEGLAELTAIFPSLQSLAPEAPSAGLVDERYRAHRAVRELLANLAVRQPVVLALDDVHWADGASAELLGHLVRRPPGGAVVVAVAFRARQAPGRLAEALAAARDEDRVEQVEPLPLSPDQATRLVAGLDAPTSDALYRESGGNPFYLEQLARAPGAIADAPGAGAPAEPALGVPAAVEAAIERELDGLGPKARALAEAAAVAGDPFEPDVAAEIADEPEADILPALDEVVALGLARPTQVPRRFAFRHPIVRRALYERTSPGWRLGAHDRAVTALRARGASVLELAHHVEQAARRGDEDAIELLRQAGHSLATRAPASAARWFAAALRLLPEEDGSAERRAELLAARAQALAATGRFDESRDAVLELLPLLPPEATPLHVRLTASCASLEHLLGHHEDAHRRLRDELDELGDEPSPETVALMVELSVDAFYVVDYAQMQKWGTRATEAAETLGDGPLIGAAAGILSYASVLTGDPEAAGRHCSKAAALLHGLSDTDAGRRIDAFNHVGWAAYFLGRLHESLIAFERGVALSRETAQGQLLQQLRQGQANNLATLGRLGEALAVSEASIEAARLAGTPQALSWTLGGHCLWATWAGDLDSARRAGEESLELARGIDNNALSLVVAFDFAACLVEAGEPDRAIELAVEAAGGPELPRDALAWKAFHSEILTRACVAGGRQHEAESFAALGGDAAEQLGWSIARVHAERARAAALLGAGELPAAAEAALNSAETADGLGARFDEGRARLLAGRALAAGSDRESALHELRRAEETLHECGALRWRGEAGRELRKLGVRVGRGGRGGATGDEGVASLTDREREIAELVWDRKTNAEIAAELFVSKKTVETHLRNIFRKLDVSSRVGVARAIEQERDEG
jgi:DNA-binding CsgD family transcriptional regulator